MQSFLREREKYHLTTRTGFSINRVITNINKRGENITFSETFITLEHQHVKFINFLIGVSDPDNDKLNTKKSFLEANLATS